MREKCLRYNVMPYKTDKAFFYGDNMDEDYLKWLDWEPGILRSIYELGTTGYIDKENMKKHLKGDPVEVTDYLVEVNIAEYDDEDKLILSTFGREIFRKLEEINYIFSKYLELGK